MTLEYSSDIFFILFALQNAILRKSTVQTDQAISNQPFTG